MRLLSKVKRTPTLSLCSMVTFALLLSGCAADGSAPSRTASPTDGSEERVPHISTSQLRGVVVDPAIRPIGGATVRLVGDERTVTTTAAGTFLFDGLNADRIYVVQAFAPGYLVANVSVMPEMRDDVRIVLEQARNVTAYHTTQAYTGIIQCAFEALIISPSCDSAAPEGQRQFEQNYTFLYGVDLGWQTQVIDVVFDGSSHPGLDGLRIALRGIRDEVPGGEYTQYGRWHDANSFTVRIEPGGNYTDGSGPVPGNYTGFRIDVYPHGHAYHTACPGPESCFLGAGAGVDVRFDLYVTTFYGKPAPEGWTLQEA